MEDYVDSYYASTRSAGDWRPHLQGSQQTEVCVIGAGLAGLSTALELAERGIHVTLLESRRVGWGASGRNGGMVGPGFSLGLNRIIHKLGMTGAQELFALSRDGAELVRERIQQYQMPDVAMGEGIFSATLFDEVDALRRSMEFMRRNFDQHSEFWSQEKLREVIHSDSYRGAVLNLNRFMIHPLNYCRRIADAAETAGARIHENSAVTGIDRNGSEHRIRTSGGDVTAKTVVVACGGYIESLVLKLARAIVPVATYVIATEPLGENRLRSAMKFDYGVSDNRLANDYYRPLHDTRILWGGRMTVRKTRPPNLADVMARDLVAIYPQLDGIKIESAWHGLMSYPAHKMPLVGQLVPGLWYALGFGGHGLNTTTMAGSLLAGAIAGGDDRYRLLSSFGLFPTGGPVGAIAAQSTYWYYQLVDAWRHHRARQR